MLLSKKANKKNEQAWKRWLLQSARTWDDVAMIVQPINIKEIDDDHRKFTRYALDLNLIIKAYNNRDVSFKHLHYGEDIFEKLLEYADQHFQREEKLMQEMESRMLKMHQAQHAVFIQMVEKYYADFMRGRLQMVSGLKLSILDWWVNHINVVDYQTFAKYDKTHEDGGR